MLTECDCDDFDPIDPKATRVLTFRFAAGLVNGSSLAGSVTVEITGAGDPDPTTRFSSAQIQGSNVLIAATGCIAGVTYHLRVIVTTTDPENTLVIGTNLQCLVF